MQPKKSIRRGRRFKTFPIHTYWKVFNKIRSGSTITGLAKSIDVDRTSINRWIKNHNHKMGNTIRLAQMLYEYDEMKKDSIKWSNKHLPNNQQLSLSVDNPVVLRYNLLKEIQLFNNEFPEEIQMLKYVLKQDSHAQQFGWDKLD